MAYKKGGLAAQTSQPSCVTIVNTFFYCLPESPPGPLGRSSWNPSGRGVLGLPATRVSGGPTSYSTMRMKQRPQLFPGARSLPNRGHPSSVGGPTLIITTVCLLRGAGLFAASPKYYAPAATGTNQPSAVQYYTRQPRHKTLSR